MFMCVDSIANDPSFLYRCEKMSHQMFANVFSHKDCNMSVS